MNIKDIRESLIYILYQKFLKKSNRSKRSK
uniref:Uncharacterized protein n=1 Tax=Siphoviridae sp. ctTnV63 TaxID=2825523 RepID=A0A8S5NXD6_9CAUD|nr:MAG TPA: hypothetical protein [Siphoviridae sp. ctTnV63]